MESEETKDHVREAKSTEYEEEEERTFERSAVSVPLKPLFRCDNQCSEKTFSLWQLVSVVVNEGDEAYTTNLCQKCFNKRLQAEGEKPLSNVQWRQAVERKAYRGRMWRKDGERTLFAWDVGALFPRKKSLLKKRSRQEYKVSGSRNHEPENTWSK